MPADAGGEERPRRGAILVTRDDRGRVLLVRQRAGPFAGAWLLPGGGLEDGESYEAALRREVLEETGLVVGAIRAVAAYDVRAPAFWGEVRLYAGTVEGTPRVGADGEPVEWTVVDPRSAHPVLMRELRDAGLADIDDEIERRSAALGIRLTRIG